MFVEFEVLGNDGDKKVRTIAIHQIKEVEQGTVEHTFVVILIDGERFVATGKLSKVVRRLGGVIERRHEVAKPAYATTAEASADEDEDHDNDFVDEDTYEVALTDEEIEKLKKLWASRSYL